MDIEIQDLENDIKKIVLEGRLDIKGSSEIEAQFSNHVATKKAGIVVEMSGVDFIASIGMRLLLSNARAVQKWGGKMVLLNPTDLVDDALKISGIDQLIEVYRDEAAAIADLKAWLLST